MLQILCARCLYNPRPQRRLERQSMAMDAVQLTVVLIQFFSLNCLQDLSDVAEKPVPRHKNCTSGTNAPSSNELHDDADQSRNGNIEAFCICQLIENRHASQS